MTWLLVALNLLAAYWLISVYGQDRRLQAGAAVDAVGQSNIPPLPVYEPVLDSDISAILERPLFNETRQPEKTDDEDVDDKGQNSDINRYRLIGVVLLPEISQALLLMPNREIEEIRLGEKFEGWELKSIDADNAVFEKAGTTVELPLERKSDVNPTLQTRRSKIPITKRLRLPIGKNRD
jgi:hypothetical protein